MLFRRFAVFVALLLAGLSSQLPEFTQQYRQRLGGAIDELAATVAQFDQEASGQSLTREQGVARLAANSDPLAQARGEAVTAAADRAERLRLQREAFRTSGPLSQYAVLAERLDAGIARRTLGDFEPALPVTSGGLFAAIIGFLVGWLGTHLLSQPFRRRRRHALPAEVQR